MRAEIMISNSRPELLSEFIKLTVFGASNNFGSLDDRGILKQTISNLRQSGIMNISFGPKFHADTTLSAFMEKLFQAVFRCELEREDAVDKSAFERGNRAVLEWMLLSGQNPDILVRFPGQWPESALQASVGYNRVDLVQLLLGAHADPNLTYLGVPTTPLCLAIRARFGPNMEMIRLLLSSGAEANPPALCDAISLKDMDLVRLLVEHGAEANPPALCRAISLGNMDLVRLLVEHGADLRCPEGLCGLVPDLMLTPMGWAASYEGDIETALSLTRYIIESTQAQFPSSSISDIVTHDSLLAAAAYGNDGVLGYFHRLSVDVNSPNHEGTTALHAAAQHGRLRTCQLLLQLGAQVDGSVGVPPPLHLASFGGHQDVIELLVANCPAALDSKYKALPRDTAERQLIHRRYRDIIGALWREDGGVSPYAIALRVGHLDCARKLAELRASYTGDEVLLAAAQVNPELLCVALRSGGNPNGEDSQGRTPVQVALGARLCPSGRMVISESARTRVITALLGAGAVLKGGELLTAIRSGNASVVRGLLAYSAALKGGELLTAVESGNASIVRDLLAHGTRLEGGELLTAVCSGNASIVRDLLAHGAGPEGIELLIAIKSGNTSVVGGLLAHGAALKGGELLAAAESGNASIVGDLLAHGAVLEGGESLAAVWSGNASILSDLLAHGAVLEGGESLAAVKSGNASMLRDLLAHGAVLGGGELLAAVKSGNASIVEMLLAHGAFSKELETTSQETGMLEAAILSKNSAIIEMVQGLDLPYEAGAICAAIETGRGLEDISYLIAKRAPGSSPQPLEGTAVSMTVAAQDSALLQLLLYHLPPSNDGFLPPFDRTDISQRRRCERFWGDANYERPYQNVILKGSPLVPAVQNRDGPMVSRLLDHGFRPDWLTLAVLSNTGDMALAECIIKAPFISRQTNIPPPTRNSDFESPIFCATKKGHLEMLRLLLTTRLEVDCESLLQPSRTPLQFAVEGGDLQMMEVLLEAGADVNAPPPEKKYGGATALQLATIKGHLGIAKRLLDLGADPNARRGLEEGGRTALEGAAEHGRIDMIELLMQHGTRTTGIWRRQYLRAIELAAQMGHHVAANLLRGYREWTVEDEAMMDKVMEDNRRKLSGRIIRGIWPDEVDGDLEDMWG